MRVLRAIVLPGLVALWSCQPAQTDTQASTEEVVLPLSHAEGFALYDGPGYYRVDIMQPSRPGTVMESYYLVDDTALYQPEEGRLEIPIPVRDWSAISTTHAGFLSALGRQEVLKGITGSRWIHDAKIRQGLEAGQVRDLGENGMVDHERLISLQPDVLVAYDGGLEAEGEAGRIRQMGIPVVLVHEFLETHPLGMAEWIKLFAVMLDDTAGGNARFREIESRYTLIRDKAAGAQTRPQVMTGLPYRGEWTVSGGRSFAATYMRDAGGAYVWADDERTGNFPVSLEEVLHKAGEADIWLNPGGASSLEAIEQTDRRLVSLPPMGNGKVFNINKRINAYGGNDYWESAVAAPDRVLLDLALIFHPDQFPRDTLFYYTQLE